MFHTDSEKLTNTMNSIETSSPELLWDYIVEYYHSENAIEQNNHWTQDWNKVPQTPLPTFGNGDESQDNLPPSDTDQEICYLGNQSQIMEKRLQKQCLHLIEEIKEKLAAQIYCEMEDLEKLKDTLNEEPKLRQACEMELSDSKNMIADLQQSITTDREVNCRYTDIYMSSYDEIKNLTMAIQEDRHNMSELTSQLKEKYDLLDSLDCEVAELSDQLYELSADVQFSATEQVQELMNILKIDSSALTDDFVSEKVSEPNDFSKHQLHVLSEGLNSQNFILTSIHEDPDKPVSKTESSEPDWTSELVFEGKTENKNRRRNKGQIPLNNNNNQREIIEEAPQPHEVNPPEPSPPKPLWGDMMEEYDLENEAEGINHWRPDGHEVSQTPLSSYMNEQESQDSISSSRSHLEVNYLTNQLQIMKNRLQQKSLILVKERNEKLGLQNYCGKYWEELEELRDTLSDETKLRRTYEQELNDCRAIIAGFQESNAHRVEKSGYEEVYIMDVYEMNNLKMELQKKDGIIHRLTSELRQKDELMENLDFKVAELTVQLSELTADVPEVSTTEKEQELMTVLKIDSSVQTDDFLSEQVSKPNNFSNNTPKEDLTIPEDLALQSEVSQSKEAFVSDGNPPKLYNPSLWRQFKKWVTPKHKRQYKHKRQIQNED